MDYINNLNEQIDKNKITHLRFILTLFVIMIHTYNLTLVATSNCVLNFIEELFSNNICRIAVPLFYCISGYLFFYKVTCFKDIFTKLKKRIRSVVLPYLMWNIIYTVVFLVVFQIPVIKHYINNNDVFTISNLLNGIFHYKYSFHFWYIENLILFFAITPLLFYTLKNFICSSAVLGVLLFVNILNINLFDIKISSLFYFYLGAYMVKWFHSKAMASKKRTLFSSCILILYLSLCVISTLYPNDIFNRLVRLVGLVCLWVTFDLLPKVKVRRFEEQSFFIFGIHVLVLEFIEKMIFSFFGSSVYVAFLDYIISPWLTLLLIYVLYRVLIKVLPKTYAFINGNR